MGNLCTHRVAPRSEGDGLHVMVGNDLQDRSTVRCSSSVPSLARFPWDWPSVGITSSRSPGYEPQATRRRAETPGELLRPGSKLRDLQGRGSLKVSRDRSQKAFRVIAQIPLPPGMGGVGHSGPGEEHSAGNTGTHTSPRRMGTTPAGPGGDAQIPARFKSAMQPPAAPRSHLLAVRGHEVEAAGGDGQGDGHAGELQVAFAQDGVQRAAAGLGENGSVEQLVSTTTPAEPRGQSEPLSTAG